MSDSGSMNLDLGVNLGVTLDGAGLQELSNTIKEISKGKDLQRYWKDVESATDSAAKAIERYNKNVNSKGLAENLLKQINALKALTKKENLSELFPNMELNLDELVESAKKIVPQINSQFSVDSFSQAFKTFDLLKEKSIDLTEAFRKLADYADLVSRNSELSRENSQFRELIGDSDVEEVKSKLSEIKRLRDQAEEIFTSFLKVNNVERTDYWGDEKFSDYFDAIRKGSLTATEAISRFKTEYAYLLEEGFKSNNDTFGLEQLQAFSNKLDSIFRQVEETSTKINDIISNGVITKSVENLSMDSSLSDSQRSLFGNLLQDEESLKSITALFQKLIEESNKTSKVDLFNDEQLQQVLSIFDKMEKHLSSLRSIISDVGDGEEFSPLLKMINNVQSSISELATSVKGIGLNMNIDVGSDGELDRKLQSKIANALQAYQKLFNNIKMSSAGGSFINQEFFDFNLDNYDTAYQKLQAIVNFIKKQRVEAKKQFNGYDALYEDSDKSLWKSAQAYLAQVTKAETEIKKANSGESNPLENLFGNTKDLSEVIEQLNKVVEKLNEISSSATEFKNIFKEGFNVTASVEEIDKLTNKVKELEDELAKIKLNPVNVDKSNISSANSLSKMIKDWSEADKFLSSNGHKNSERFALFNAKTGYTSNQHLYDKADEISGELNLALIKQMEEAGQEITGAIHSHNDTNVASFSVEDLRVALNLLDRGITQHLVLAQNELMSLDMTKVNTNDFSKMVEKLEIAYEELNQELLNGLHGQANIIIEQAEKQIGGSIIKDTLSGSLDNALNKNGVFEKLPKELIDELYRIAKTASENIKYELGNDDGLSQIGKTFLSYFDFDSYLQDDSISSDTKKAIETLKNNINTATISEFDRLSNRLDFSGLVPEDVLQSEMQHLIKMAFKNMGLSDALKIQSVDDYIKENPPIKDVFQGEDKSATDASTTAIKEESKALEQVSTSAKEASDSKEKFAKANKEVKASADSSKASISEEEKYFNSLGKSLGQYQNTLTAISRKPADGNRSKDLQDRIDTISSSLDELRTLESNASKDGYIFNEKDVNRGKELEKIIKDNIEAVKQMSAAQKGSTPLSRGKAIEWANDLLEQNSKWSKKAKNEVQGWINKLATADPSNVEEIRNRILEVVRAEREAGNAGKTWLDIFSTKKLHIFLGQAASMFSFYDLINVGREGFETIRELDTALTEMKKVSDETTQSLKNYQSTTFDVGDAVGATAKTIQNSTADWMRLGESIDEAAESAKVSNILLNVSEFESIDEATESLVAMSQAYSELGKMDIIDVLNNIGNNYSIATDGLATALQKSASALKTANNDLNSAVALATAGNAVVQDPDSVGAGIRTISLRLVGTEAAKQELESIGEETDDVITTTSKLRDTILSATAAATNDGKGFDIFDSNGNYKSTYEIMQGLADLYDDIVAKDKELGTNNLNLLLETIAGKNRSNIAASILQNGEMLRSVYQDAQNSSGSAQKELDSYLDSIDGRMTQLENRAQEFWYKVIDSDAIKNGITLLTDLLELGTNIVDTFGILPTIMTGIGAGLAFKNVGRLKMQSLIVLNCRQ